jgi:hypothetical protein
MLQHGEFHAFYRSRGFPKGSVEEDTVGSAVTRKSEKKMEENQQEYCADRRRRMELAHNCVQ